MSDHYKRAPSHPILANGVLDLKYIQSLSLILVLGFLNSSLLAESARFNVSSNILELDCVRVPLADNATYVIELLYNGEIFQLQSLEESSTSATCPNTFDQLTNTLNATVRVVDDSYQLALTLSGDNSFSILSVENLGPGPTSLWLVSNGVNEVIIGGTIHVLLPSDFPLPPAYTQALAQSDILVTEIGASQDVDLSLYAPLLRIDDGELPLTSSLSDETYQALSDYLLPTGFTALNYEYVDPNWVESDINGFALSNLGYGPGVESHIEGLALDEGKPIWALETVLDQIQAINTFNQHLTADQIIRRALNAVENPTYSDAFRSLVNAWREGNVEFIQENVLDPAMAESITDFNTLFRDRDAKWVPQIEEFFATKEVELVLVGLGHLVGDGSVLDLLEELGYLISKY